MPIPIFSPLTLVDIMAPIPYTDQVLIFDLYSRLTYTRVCMVIIFAQSTIHGRVFMTIRSVSLGLPSCCDVYHILSYLKSGKVLKPPSKLALKVQ